MSVVPHLADEADPGKVLAAKSVGSRAAYRPRPWREWAGIWKYRMSHFATATSLETTNKVDEEITLRVEPSVDQAAWLARRYRDRHVTMLVLSTAILGLSFTLGICGSGQDAAVVAWGHKLPSLCGSRSWFGVECPGCGLTRSFVAFASGNWAASLQYHRLGWVLFLAVAFQLPFRIYLLRELRTHVVPRAWPDWFGRALIVALICNWLVDIVW